MLDGFVVEFFKAKCWYSEIDRARFGAFGSAPGIVLEEGWGTDGTEERGGLVFSGVTGVGRVEVLGAGVTLGCSSLVDEVEDFLFSTVTD